MCRHHKMLIQHTHGRSSLYEIISSTDKSHRTKSNHNISNQIKPNQIKSNQIISNNNNPNHINPSSLVQPYSSFMCILHFLSYFHFACVYKFKCRSVCYNTAWWGVGVPWWGTTSQVTDRDTFYFIKSKWWYSLCQMNSI